MRKKIYILILTVILALIFPFTDYPGYLCHTFREAMDLINETENVSKPVTDVNQGLHSSPFDRQARDRQKKRTNDN
jgi:hypothetical protein